MICMHFYYVYIDRVRSSDSNFYLCLLRRYLAAPHTSWRSEVVIDPVWVGLKVAPPGSVTNARGILTKPKHNRLFLAIHKLLNFIAHRIINCEKLQRWLLRR